MKSASNVVHIGMRTEAIQKAMEDMFGRYFMDPSRMVWLAGQMEERGMIRRKDRHMHINFLFATAFKCAVREDEKNKRISDINRSFEAAYRWQRYVLYEVHRTLSGVGLASVKIDENEVLVVSEFTLDVGLIEPRKIVFMNRGRLGFFIKEYRKRRHLFFNRWWTACEHIYAQHEDILRAPIPTLK